ncbi:MAG: zinc-ribbon domain-containing protein [Coprobacillus sp.]|nr:zinc-ribbon domain-containing protein [Coprobacillus sp.]
MYCKKCGQQISEDSQFCPYCGEPQFNRDPENGNPYLESTSEQRRKDGMIEKNNLGLAGFIVSLIGLVSLGLVILIIGLVLSYMGYKRREQFNEYNKLARIGIILGIIGIAIWLIVVIIVAVIIVV